MSFACLALVLLALPSAARDTAKSVRVVAVSGTAPGFSTRLNGTFERVLSGRADVEVQDVETVAIVHRGHDYELPASTAAGVVDALDTADAVFYLAPARPELFQAVRDAARTDPSLPPTYTARVRLSPGKAVVEESDPVPAARRATLAVVYRLRVAGEPTEAVFLLRTRGGVGRAATVVDEAKAGGLPALVVSHGGWGSSPLRTSPRGRALLEALEKAGVEVSAVGTEALRSWDQVAAYRRERPGGVALVSANLIAPDAVAAEAVVERGGLRIAVLGLTDPAAARVLPPGSPLRVEDPVEAAERRVAELRPRVDLIVALADLREADVARLRARARGLDVIVAPADELQREDDEGRGGSAFQEWRGDFSPALMTVQQSDGVDRLDVLVGPRDKDGLRRLEVKRTERPLDETVATRADFPRVSMDDFRPGPGSGPVLLPGEHRLFPAGEARLTPRAFWSLSASVLADRLGAEIAVLPARELGAPTPGDFREMEVRSWFGGDDRVEVFDLDGDELLDLVRQAGAESFRPTPGKPQLAVGGVGPKETVHGAKIDRNARYRVAATDGVLALAEEYPALGRARTPKPRGDLEELVIGGLRDLAAAGTGRDRYLSLLDGEPVRETPVWTVNFRDLSVNYSSTRVVRDAQAFSNTPNSRINSFDSRTLGWAARVETDWRYRTHKWTNSLNAQYSETESYPPDEPRVIDLMSNRGTFQTNWTERAGSGGAQWLADSYGPSLGLMWDGELKRRRPGARRRGTASVLPGFEAYDGTFIRSLQIAGNIQRDYSLSPPKSDYGSYVRALFESNVRLPGGSAAKLVGEAWTSWFFRRPEDQPGDLLLEGDVNARLAVPLWRGASLAPFVDLYWFKLKERPVSGYSAMTGLSLGFSGLWKPQYERL